MAKNTHSGGLTNVGDYLVWTLADTIPPNSKTGRDESPSGVQIPPSPPFSPPIFPPFGEPIEIRSCAWDLRARMDPESVSCGAIPKNPANSIRARNWQGPSIRQAPGAG
jgi:hypothetical protein